MKTQVFFSGCRYIGAEAADNETRRSLAAIQFFSRRVSVEIKRFLPNEHSGLGGVKLHVCLCECVEGGTYGSEDGTMHGL